MIKNIPDTLYKKKVIYLPPQIIKTYKKKLIKYKIYSYAEKYDPKEKSLGGKDKKSTLQHFARRFQNSGSRTEYLILNPDKVFNSTQKDLLSTFGYGEVSILDIPCGTGGGIFTLLSTIAELKKNNVIDTLPLNLNILAADFSKDALKVYDDFLKNIIPFFIKYGINVLYKTKYWDATDVLSTTKLMDQYLKLNCNEYYILVNNFSSAVIGNSGNSEILDNFIKCILPRMNNKKFTFLWIEPILKKSKKLFKRLIEKINKFLKYFFKYDKIEINEAEYSWYDAIQKHIVKKGSIRLNKYSRQ